MTNEHYPVREFRVRTGSRYFVTDYAAEGPGTACCTTRGESDSLRVANDLAQLLGQLHPGSIVTLAEDPLPAPSAALARVFSAARVLDDQSTPNLDARVTALHVLREFVDYHTPVEQKPEPPSSCTPPPWPEWMTVLRASRRTAEERLGWTYTAELHDWAVARCDADLAFNASMHASADPYEAARLAREQERATRQ